MTNEQREEMISQIMAVTPTKYALNAIDILDGTANKGVKNIANEVSDEHGRQFWIACLASI